MPKIFKDKNDNVLYTGYETSEIVANPTLAGTEANLTGLQVGNTKYAVPQGGSEQHLYKYDIYISLTQITYDGDLWISFILLSSTKLNLTINNIIEYLINNYSNKMIAPCYGFDTHTEQYAPYITIKGTVSSPIVNFLNVDVNVSSQVADFEIQENQIF